MIGTSFGEYVLIRTSIFALRAITPLSVIFTFATPFIYPWLRKRPVLSVLKYWAFLETGFFVFAFLPLKIYLQREPSRVSTLPSPQRRELFTKCMDTVPDQDTYLRKWFLNAPLEDIRRDNIKEFLAWSLLNKKFEDVTDDENDELDLYVKQIESSRHKELEEGKGKAKALRLAFDEVTIWHRPLLWYLIIWAVEVRTSLRLFYHGWSFYGLPVSRLFNSFPPRLFAGFVRARSPAKTLTYWHRKRRSESSIPILFIHGIGIGLHPYVDFLNNLARGLSDASDSEDPEQFEVIAVEIMPICARICSGIVSADEMKEEIRAIVDKHGWTNFVLVSHSFGTAVAATLCKDAGFLPRIKQLVLLDPICFLLHLPDVAYNFTRRAPNRANEYLLHYFSSTDMMISHTLARRFFWTEYILWLEDIANVPTFVTLSERDLVINSAAVWEYLTDSSEIDETMVADPSSKGYDLRAEMTRSNVEVWKFARLDHAQVFDYTSTTNAVALRIRQRIAPLE